MRRKALLLLVLLACRFRSLIPKEALVRLQFHWIMENWVFWMRDFIHYIW